jgi:methionyl aminopeptidase
VSQTKIILKTAKEVETIRQAGRILHGCQQLVRAAAVERIRTRELDAMAEEYIRKNGGVPAFKGYHGFPASLCISVNEEVVHGIPNNRRLKSGDVVSVDCGVIWEEFIADAAITLAIGEIDETHKKLMQITEESLYLGIAQAQSGNHVHAISAAVQEHVEKHGFSIVRDLVGHGVGRSMHEEPQVPNFVSEEKGALLEPGMVIAIEPMVNVGGYQVNVKKDRWTIITTDRKYSAHFEHTVAITKNGPDILTNGK